MPLTLKKPKERALWGQEVFSSIHSDCIRSHAFYKLSKTCWGQEGRGDTHQNSPKEEKKGNLHNF